MDLTDWGWAIRVIMAGSGQYASAWQLIRTQNCASAPYCAPVSQRCQRQAAHSASFVHKVLDDQEHRSHGYNPILHDRQGHVTQQLADTGYSKVSLLLDYEDALLRAGEMRYHRVAP